MTSERQDVVLQLHLGDPLPRDQHLTLNTVCDPLDMSSLASMNSLQVWWLDLTSVGYNLSLIHI